jgi:Uma2 family endonuclease
MVAETSPRRATIADLERTPDDGRRYELIDGEIVVAAAPLWPHQYAVRAIFRLLDGWSGQHQPSEAMFAPYDIDLDGRTVVQPDAFVLLGANVQGIDPSGRFHGVPDLVVEVLSPTDRSRDTVTKLYHYGRVGVPEYWIVDPILRTLDVLALSGGPGGQYIPQAPDDQGHVASVVLPGLTVDPAPLFVPEAGAGPA